ncbi:HAD family hydrolase [Sphaerochaeta sp. PS]|uniref:HAD family hydrolase n=1 Tax=Sphaerochaeta sp. PS TaxID=3076336 RepID=UPI0028A41636|nr:HAD family hydrolase [Sphaerochaeta sp. PS]MDT4760955.1 HAD family hydrolase [Sphaerochaeta sp. PS]
MGFLVDQDIKVLCLDIDGTLYPKRMLNARMLRSAFPSLPLGLGFNQVRQEYRRVQDSEPTVPADRQGLLQRQAHLMLSHLGKKHDANSVEAMMARLDRQFYQAWQRSFLSIKGSAHMREALVKAKQQGLKIAVFSDFPVARKLETLGIDSLVDLALSSEDSGYLKPSPKAFSYLLAHLDGSPSEMLYVGDSYSKDCQGAKRMGMRSCLLTRSRGEFSDADLVVSSWKEFISLLL